MGDVPLLVITVTIWAYWIRVGAMVRRARRRTGNAAGLVPQQPLERLMWVVWVPLVGAWMALPLLGMTKAGAPFAVPEFERLEPVYAALRWVAAATGVGCLMATQRCWARMGAAWRMDVRNDRTTELITDGLFARVRHPIYALSMLLVLCTAVVVATVPMLVVATVHIVLMNLKARNEERHLSRSLGAQYEDYLRQTGRFLPRRGVPSR